MVFWRHGRVFLLSFVHITFFVTNKLWRRLSRVQYYGKVVISKCNDMHIRFFANTHLHNLVLTIFLSRISWSSYGKSMSRQKEFSVLQIWRTRRFSNETCFENNSFNSIKRFLYVCGKQSKYEIKIGRGKKTPHVLYKVCDNLFEKCWDYTYCQHFFLVTQLSWVRIWCNLLLQLITDLINCVDCKSAM